MRSAALASALVWIATAAHAGDGRVEINHACAATGCFAGDTAGYPVTIPSSGSYVLTSDLALPSAVASGVVVADGATLDLNGFAITGPNTCSGTPTVCTIPSGGSGVSLGEGSVVRNGAIRGMGGAGVSTNSKLVLVEDVWIDQNGSGGIQAGVADGSVVRRCRVSRNGGRGINLIGGNGSPGSIVADNVVYANAEEGILVNSAVVRGNSVRSNGELGLSINFVDASSGFGDNVINDNNGGNVNAQTSGGHQLGTNVCGDKTTCP